MKKEYEKFITDNNASHNEEVKEIKGKFENLITDIQNSHKIEIKEINSKSEKEMKDFRYQVLNEMIFIKDEDLEFNIPLKKRNCFHIKNIQRAKELNGITSIDELKRVIDDGDFQDMIEVKNTLNCLEGVIEEWKNEKLTIDELDQELELKQDSMNGNQKIILN